MLTINEKRSQATVQYFGFKYFIGKGKFNEPVQLDDQSKTYIGNLVSFFLQTKCIKDFDRFQKGVTEIQAAMEFSHITENIRKS